LTTLPETIARAQTAPCSHDHKKNTPILPLRAHETTPPPQKNSAGGSSAGGGGGGGDGDASFAETSAAAAWSAVLGAVQVLCARRLDAGRVAAVARVLLDALQIALVLLSPRFGWGLVGGGAAGVDAAAAPVAAAADPWWRLVNLPLLHPAVEKLVRRIEEGGRGRRD
jgi:hypothetical protein